MDGYPIEVACKTLILILRSLSVCSYYQIIEFGSLYNKYDETHKEYTQINLEENIKFIKILEAELVEINIYNPLEDIYNSVDSYNKLNYLKIFFY